MTPQKWKRHFGLKRDTDDEKTNVTKEKSRQMALQLGLGGRTGIEIGGEREGLVPSDAWKRRVQGDAWRSGDTANVSIGQGQLLVTPLQMAVYTAALANGGRVYRPRLVREPARPEDGFVRELALGRALRYVLEHRVFINGLRTVVLR